MANIFGIFTTILLCGTYYSLVRASLFPTPHNDHEYFVVPIILAFGMMFILPALGYFALPIWWFTTPEPGVQGWQIIRRATRWTALAAGISSLVVLPLTLGGPFFLYTYWSGPCLTCLTLWAITLTALSVYMMRFAWRVPRRKLIVETLLVMLVVTGIAWAGVGALILAIAGLIGHIFAQGQEQLVADISRYVTLAMLVAFVALWFMMLGMLIWWITLFLKYHAMFALIRAQQISASHQLGWRI